MTILLANAGFLIPQFTSAVESTDSNLRGDGRFEGLKRSPDWYVFSFETCVVLPLFFWGGLFLLKESLVFKILDKPKLVFVKSVVGVP